MSNELEPETNSDQPAVFQIRIKGYLSREWAGWFEGLAITLEEDGDTLLTGPVIDQTALHGLLKKVRDLGLPLVSVCPQSVLSNPGSRLLLGQDRRIRISQTSRSNKYANLSGIHI